MSPVIRAGCPSSAFGPETDLTVHPRREAPLPSEAGSEEPTHRDRE
jgi:hypothetical protein